MRPDRQNIAIKRVGAGHRDLIETVARWYQHEWSTPIEQTIKRLVHQSDEGIPFHLVLTIDDEAVAAGGIRNQVNIYKSHPQLMKFRPWLALLYTHKDYRNRGFGELLLDRIEKTAKTAGQDTLYLYTFTAESLYKRCGWREIDRVIYKDHDTVIMKKEL